MCTKRSSRIPRQSSYATTFLFHKLGHSFNLLAGIKANLPISGIEEVGCIRSHFDDDFDFGPDTQSKYNSRLGKIVYQLCHQIQVRFGTRGANLTFANIVNGKTVSTAAIEFDRR